MTLRHLKVFVAVCKLGSITRAAEELRVAQPSVSLTVKELESYYGVTLFDRLNQRLVLTDFGKEAFLRAKEVLAAFDSFEGLMKQSRTNVTLHIGASLTLGQAMLPMLWRRIEERFPEVRCNAVIRQTHAIEQQIEDGQLDFAIVEGGISSPKLSAVPLARDFLAAVSSPSFPAPDRLTLNELAEKRLLLREEGSASRDLFEHLLRVRGLAVRPDMESANNEALIAAAEAGLGIAVLPLVLVENKLGTVLRRLEISDADLTRSTYLIFHKNRKFSSRQKELLDLCMTECRRQAEESPYIESVQGASAAH